MLHSRRESLTPSQTHDARVKYHDGEPDELDRIMHESRKEFAFWGQSRCPSRRGALDKKGRDHSQIVIVDVRLSMEDKYSHLFSFGTCS
jgi:hypothetical protein